MRLHTFPPRCSCWLQPVSITLLNSQILFSTLPLLLVQGQLNQALAGVLLGCLEVTMEDVVAEAAGGVPCSSSRCCVNQLAPAATLEHGVYPVRCSVGCRAASKLP